MTKTACQEDVALVHRLLTETGRAHPQGRVFGGRTGLTMVQALRRLAGAARDDLVTQDVRLAPLAIARLDALLEDLDRAAQTLEVELADRS